MSMTLERLRSEIQALPHEERLSLWMELQNEFDPPDDDEDVDQGAEEAWDEEIASRVREVEEGSVKLIPMEEVERELDEFFAKRGMTRERYIPNED